MKNKDVNNPNDYEFKSLDLCVTLECTNPAEWFIEEGIGKCMDCYKELEEEHLSNKKSTEED